MAEKTTLVLVHEHYSKEHLEEVKAEMLTLGSPTLYGVVINGDVYLLEGCHRARAAAALGVTVNVVPVNYDWETDDEIMLSDYVPNNDTDGSTVGSVVGVGATESRCVICDVELLDEIEPNRSE
jgi:hypothetical protein